MAHCSMLRRAGGVAPSAAAGAAAVLAGASASARLLGGCASLAAGVCLWLLGPREVEASPCQADQSGAHQGKDQPRPVRADARAREPKLPHRRSLHRQVPSSRSVFFKYRTDRTCCQLLGRELAGAILRTLAVELEHLVARPQAPGARAAEPEAGAGDATANVQLDGSESLLVPLNRHAEGSRAAAWS